MSLSARVGCGLWQVPPKDNGTTLAFLFLQQGKSFPTPGPLPVLFALPGLLFPQVPKDSCRELGSQFTRRLLKGAFPRRLSHCPVLLSSWHLSHSEVAVFVHLVLG